MRILITLVISVLLILYNRYGYLLNGNIKAPEPQNETNISFQIPEYEGKPYTIINKNKPQFTEKELHMSAGVIQLTALDNLGRCGTAIGMLGPATLAKEKRSPIGMVKPSGWKISKYDFIDQKYLYNRCHLIAHSLSGINADPKNLITGTRYMNVKGMLPFEIEINEWIRKTKGHVLYKVKPVFVNNELVARGVHMQAFSINGNGALQFNVFVHNVQPGIQIDYKNGNNKPIN